MINKACQATRLFFLSSGIAAASWAPMVPYAKLHLNLSDADLGLMLLLMGIGALLAMPISGYLVHHYGSRKLIPVASPILSLILPLLALAPNIICLGVTLFLFGSMLGMMNISVNKHAIAVEKKIERPMMSNFHCILSLGGLIGAASMTLLLKLGVSLFSSSLLLSTFIILVTVTQYKHLIDCHSKNDEEKQTKQSRFPPPIVLFLGFFCFISFLAEGAMLDWGAILLRSAHGYEISMAGIGYAFFAVAMAFGRLIGNYLRSNLGDLFIIRAGGGIAAFGLLLAVHAPWSPIQLLGFFLVGLGASNIVPTLFSSAGRISGVSPSLALTTMTTLGYVGMIFGSATIGFVAQATSISLALSGVAMLLVIISIWGQSADTIAERELFRQT